MTFKKTLLNDGQTFIFMEMAGIKHRGLVTLLCSNFQDVPGIIGFLQMMFTVTCGVIVKRAYVFSKEYVSPYHVTRV